MRMAATVAGSVGVNQNRLQAAPARPIQSTIGAATFIAALLPPLRCELAHHRGPIAGRAVPGAWRANSVAAWANRDPARFVSGPRFRISSAKDRHPPPG